MDSKIVSAIVGFVFGGAATLGAWAINKTKVETERKEKLKKSLIPCLTNIKCSPLKKNIISQKFTILSLRLSN